MKTQKEAVYDVVLSFYGTKFQNGMSHSSENKSKMVDILLESYNKGEWKIDSEKSKAEKAIKSYVMSLLNNHLKKDTRLNGGEKYVPEKPGSRTGIINPQVKALRQLRKTLTDGSAEAKRVDDAITSIVDSIKAERAKADIDVDNLPPEFRGFVK